MPSHSAKQHRFMEAIAHNPKFAKQTGVPQSVGKDFASADKGRKFNQGGEMKEPKGMMRKEIAFMKAKGAPAKMIKHEEAEERGYARGGETRAKKEVREDQRKLGSMAAYKQGGRVKRMADGGMTALSLPPQMAQKNPTAASPQQPTPQMTQGAMPRPGAGGFAGGQGMQDRMNRMGGMQGRMGGMQGMPQGGGQFQGQMPGMQGGMQRGMQINPQMQQPRGMQTPQPQTSLPPQPQMAPPPQMAPQPEMAPPPKNMLSSYKKGGTVKKMAKGGMASEPKGGMQKFIGGQRELAVGNRPHGEHAIQEKGKTRGKDLQPEGNVGITSTMKKGGTVKKYAAGGHVGSASRRADGCATKGKTKGRYI